MEQARSAISEGAELMRTSLDQAADVSRRTRLHALNHWTITRASRQNAPTDHARTSQGKLADTSDQT